MRPGIMIAIVAAVAVVIGGVFWYNSNNQAEQARLEEQLTVQAAQDAREEERENEEQVAREAERAREEAAEAADEVVRETEEAEALPAEDAVIEEAGALPAEDAVIEEAGVSVDDRTVVGDEITEGAIVVQSTTDGPILFEAGDTVTTAENVGDAGTVAAATTTEPEQLLTPDNFDRDEVLALIDDAQQLTGEQRATLRALVEEASTNPATVDTAIESIRASFDLPPLN